MSMTQKKPPKQNKKQTNGATVISPSKTMKAANYNAFLQPVYRTQITRTTKNKLVLLATLCAYETVSYE